ncbi:MAG TPA: DUF4350 domain-containing protein [Anaerolineae bacterium]|nr:DUF4350 domain-containing protein [Anaerolineae bacterium]
MIRRWRGRIRSDLVIVLLLLAALVGFSGFTAARRTQNAAAPDYSTHGTQPGGTAALYAWLEKLGYRVQRIENGPFRIEDEARLLFVLAPHQAFDEGEARQLERWVQAADHTLVLVVQGSHGAGVVREFGVRSVSLPAVSEVLTVTVPVMTSPPPGAVRVRARTGLAPEENDFVAHLSAGETPVLISTRRGQGRLVIASSAVPFTNAGLRDPGSARLVHNLVAGLERGALIVFDEVHHGYTQPDRNGLLAWLYSSPWGWALIYAAAVTFGWVVLGGQRLGRPVPAPAMAARRAQSEYVVSMAQLFRRAGRRAMILADYHDRLKQHLARPWRLNPRLPDEEFVAELARVRDDLTPDHLDVLRHLLARLDGGRVSEAELVRLAGQVDEWMRGRYVH